LVRGKAGFPRHTFSSSSKAERSLPGAKAAVRALIGASGSDFLHKQNHLCCTGSEEADVRHGVRQSWDSGRRERENILAAGI